MKKLMSLLLALTLVLSLAACGKKNNAPADGVENQPDYVLDGDEQTTTPPVEEPEAPVEPQPETPDETPDETQPETETPDETQPEAPAEGEEEPAVPETPADPDAPALSHNDVSLRFAGNSFKLKFQGLEEGTAVTYTSADETIATVAEDGTVTAVGPGNVYITVTAGDLTQQCLVRCRWKVEEGTQTPDTETPEQGGETAEPAGVDLHAFYSDISGKYAFSMGMAEMTEKDVIENYFAGLSAISLKQSALYYTMFSMNNGEISMVEVENAADVEAVKAIFQARVDYMIDGGAWYPEPTEIWTNQSRIVSSGNYVLMVASKDCDSVVADFEALVG